MQQMDIVMVGAGRLATQLSEALQRQGHRIVCVYSRTMTSAKGLGIRLGTEATNELDMLPRQADAFILSVKDDVLPELIPRLAKGREQCVMLHTAGSVPMSVFGNLPNVGVLYPMQTFTKGRNVDFSTIPIYIEGSSQQALSVAQALAQSVSNKVEEVSSEQRRYLHLAAVFACNFANHCYALAAELLEAHGLKFEAMLPLIAETAEKVRTIAPRQAQTGPAVRYDEQVMKAQLDLLSSQPSMQEIYALMSRSIHELATQGAAKP